MEEHMHNDLGIYKNIRIDGYEHGRTEGKLLRLVHYDELRRKLDVDEQTLSLFQRYAAYEIAFLCVMGEKGNGKSFILDKLLNLAGVKGNHLSVNDQPGLFVWSQPFRKRNLRIFLLDCRGFNSRDVSPADQKFTALLLLLCSTVLFNNRTKTDSNDFKTFQWLLQQTFEGTVLNGRKLEKENAVTPHSLYHLYRTRTLATSTDMTHFFPNHEFTFLEDALVPNYKGKDRDLVECSFLATNCVNEKFVRHLGEIFVTVLNTIQEKTVCGVTFNGNIIGKVVRNAVQMLNREEHLDIARLFKSVIAELYVSAYNYCVISYSDALEKELQDENPKSLDGMLALLGAASDDIMTKYHEFNLDPELHRQYLGKLQDHIDLKEKLLLEINLKKTQNMIRSQFVAEPSKNIDAVLRNMESLARFRPQLDHGRQAVVAAFYAEWVEAACKNFGGYELQLKLDAKQTELENLNRKLADVAQGNGQLQSQLKSEEERARREHSEEMEAAAAVDAEVKKLQAVTRQRVSVSSNIDEMRNQYEGMVQENDRKIQGMSRQIAEVAAKGNSPPKQQPSRVGRPDVSAMRKQLNTLAAKQKDLSGILSLQEEEIRSLNNELAARSKKK